MTKISKSSERNTFQKQNYITRQIEEGKSMDDPAVKGMVDWFESWKELDLQRESDPEWQKNNLEWDLRTTDWILDKVRISKIYSQHMYAALCNNDFVKVDVVQILKEQYWSCSWRHAGGIVADMRQEGDYMNWYCGIGDGLDEKDRVGEGVVTDEIREDLSKLGWIVVHDPRNQYSF